MRLTVVSEPIQPPVSEDASSSAVSLSSEGEPRTGRTKGGSNDIILSTLVSVGVEGGNKFSGAKISSSLPILTGNSSLVSMAYFSAPLHRTVVRVARLHFHALVRGVVAAEDLCWLLATDVAHLLRYPFSRANVAAGEVVTPVARVAILAFVGSVKAGAIPLYIHTRVRL